jgi:hypothetical protein
LILHGSLASDDSPDVKHVEAMLRSIRGDAPSRIAATSPKWDWSLEALLGQGTRAWWDRWLPELNELMGRELGKERGSYNKEGRPAVVDRRGFVDIFEYFFPTVAGISWRYFEYPQAVVAQSEGQVDLRHVWEAAIRHGATALTALEETSQLQSGDGGLTRIRTLEEISGPWLRILLAIVGQSQPADLKAARRLL